MKEIKLYTTLGCHLCDQAEEMVNYLIDSRAVMNINLSLVEISQDDRLVDLYGIRIPVLANGKSELGWPFELKKLEQWLNN